MTLNGATVLQSSVSLVPVGLMVGQFPGASPSPVPTPPAQVPSLCQGKPKGFEFIFSCTQGSTGGGRIWEMMLGWGRTGLAFLGTKAD